MTPPLYPVEEAREWLRTAAEDLRLAELALDDSPPLTGGALYHAQQAAEKALKGLLVLHGIPYPLTHDVRKLLTMCSDAGAGLGAGVSAAAGLTQFAIRFRYPGEVQPSREEARPWLDLARKVCDEVSQRLPAEKEN